MAYISAIIVLAMSVWLTLQSRQWIFRHRAERLLSDVKALQVDKSDWQAAQKLMSRWGAWGTWDGQCTAEECEYSIRVDDTLWDAPQFVSEGGPHIFARLYDHLGLRSAGVVVEFQVMHNTVTSKGFWMQVALPFREWMTPDGTYWPSLDIGFREATTLQHPNPAFHLRHPSRDFHQRRITLDASFTPEESLSEQDALTAFHFDCITRWAACLNRAEILPRAEEEFEAEQRLPLPS